MLFFPFSIMQSSCKLADFGLARSLSQNFPTVDSNGNEEACLTDYVGNSNRFICNRYYDLFSFWKAYYAYNSNGQ